MDFRLLGPVEVRNGESVVSVGGAKQRALLALLLLHANEVVSRDRLIDELWGATPAPGAGHRLENHISRLRKAVELDGRLVSGRGGYALEVDPELIDACRFERLLEQGRRDAAAGETSEAVKTLREALSLWRGNALADLAYEPFARGEIERLEELRVAALEERIDADLALGRHREVVAELEALTAKHPLRERLRGQQMLALYRCGRQAEALGAYQEFRCALSEELGLEPGEGLRQLELEILNRDPALEVQGSNGSSAPPRITETAAAGGAAPSRRRRAQLAMGGVSLLVVALVGAIVASSVGGAAAGKQIPGDAVGALGASTGAVRAVVPLGTSPSAIAAGHGAVWVANYNAGTVARIDPATRAVVQTLDVGSTPTGVAVGAGDVWVTDNVGSRVFRVDPTVDRVVQSIAVGNAPSGVAVGDGSVWVANSSDGTLSRIDPTTGAVTSTTSLGGSPTGVAVGAGGVWVSDEADGRVARVDPQSDQVTSTVSVGTGPTAVAVGFGSVWVANSLDGTVSRIDPGAGSVQETIEVGNGAGSLALGAGAVWVANQYAGTVVRIDPATDMVTRRFSVGSRPQGLALARGLVWVGSQAAPTAHRGGTLRILSEVWLPTLDPVLVPSFTGGGGPLAITNDGLTAYRHIGGSASVQIVPDLAVSLPTPTDGGTTYTFQLRRGIRYSNGEPVRPQDFRRALQRDLILGPDPGLGTPFADVVGGAACAAHPRHCDLSKGVVVNDAANTVTFHLVAPDPDFLARLTLNDAVAEPAATPMHNIRYSLPATGPYMWRTITTKEAVLVRNPYFHEWSHAARPDGYVNRIVYRRSSGPAAELKAVERGAADIALDGPPLSSVNQLQTRFPSQLHFHLLAGTTALMLNTHTPPFNDIRVRRALNYAIDRAKIARLSGPGGQPTCQMLPPYMPGYRRYCPYTLDPNPAGVWHAPNLARAKQLIAASHTRGTRITIWNILGRFQFSQTTIGRYLVSLLDRLGYRAQFKDLGNDPDAAARFADSRTSAQAAFTYIQPPYLSASQMIQVPFACQSFTPNSTKNANLSEFCDPRLDAQMHTALAAESNNPARAPALWAQADRSLTDQAPFVALDTPCEIDFVSARVGNYQWSYSQDALWDQLWVR